MSYANDRPRVYLFNLDTGQQRSRWAISRHDVLAALLA